MISTYQSTTIVDENKGLSNPQPAFPGPPIPDVGFILFKDEIVPSAEEDVFFIKASGDKVKHLYFVGSPYNVCSIS
jgi:hypothetical protein